MLEHHGYDRLGRELSNLMRKGDVAAMARLVPDALMEAIAVVASPSELPAKLRQRYEGILQRVSLYFPIPEAAPEAQWQQFVTAFRATAST